MDYSKFGKETMNKSNTRSIGINTELNLLNNKCMYCQDYNFGKCNVIPYYIPFAYPLCNCIMFPVYQQNMMNSFNYCKCENSCVNHCNSHYCLKDCSSSSTCKNCSNKNSYTEEKCTSSEENISASSSKQFIKEQSARKSNKNIEENRPISIPSTSNITKFADEYLERHTYGYRQQNEDEYIKKEPMTPLTIKHLLKPNTGNESDCSESDNEDIEEDNFSGKTVLQPPTSKDENKTTPRDDDRRPTRINLPHKPNQNLQRPPNKNSEVEMIMMIKALVNNQYNNNSPHLNKLLNHIGTGTENSEKLIQQGQPTVEPQKRFCNGAQPHSQPK